MGNCCGLNLITTPYKKSLQPRESVNNYNCDCSRKYKGVVRALNGEWAALLYTHNEPIWLGSFVTEEDAAIAYDRATIMFRDSDFQRNFPWSETTDLEAKFQSLYNMGEIIAMIKDTSYEDKFYKFLEKINIENNNDLSVQKNRRPLFEKELTPTDVGKLNRLFIPMKFDVAYFPPRQDNGEMILPFYDVHNQLWEFRYSRWCYFTSGWNEFVMEKGLRAKDTIIFSYNEDLRRMEIEVKYLKSKDDGGIVEDPEKSDEVMQTSNFLETKGFKLFGVEIPYNDN